ncbi:MAG: acetylxylan esterase [Candidatus Hydrogenedentes bacterium]|nr:acetylxylan esterase [Candidatus Hydrogenedentota bacterium]
MVELSRVAIRTENASACYNIGEPVSFIIEAEDTIRPQSLATLTWDGYEPIEARPIRLTCDPVVLHVHTDRPGFVRLRVTVESSNPPLTLREAAVAIAPEQIAPSMPPPENFDAFWRSRFAVARVNPLRPELRDHSEKPECQVASVRIPITHEEAIYGWLLRPRSRGPFPALALYHGAGVYAVPPEAGADWAARGFMVFSINPHPIPNDQSAEYYAKLRDGTLSDYRTRGRESADSLYFVSMFLRAARAVDFIAQHPDWDGRHLHVEGHSQGGAQALAAAVLNEHVTGISVSCPTHCDHSGPVIGRVPGWPRIVEVSNGKPNRDHVRAAAYIDGVNFASRIQCPALVGVCFLDELCPPTGIYAAYNALRGPKTIHHEPTTAHVHADAYREAAFRWAARL